MGVDVVVGPHKLMAPKRGAIAARRPLRSSHDPHVQIRRPQDPPAPGNCIKNAALLPQLLEREKTRVHSVITVINEVFLSYQGYNRLRFQWARFFSASTMALLGPSNLGPASCSDGARRRGMENIAVGVYRLTGEC